MELSGGHTVLDTIGDTIDHSYLPFINNDLDFMNLIQ